MPLMSFYPHDAAWNPYYLEEGKGLADSRSTDSGEQRLSQESEESRAQ